MAARRRHTLQYQILYALQSLDCDDDARMAFHTKGPQMPGSACVAPSAARAARQN